MNKKRLLLAFAAMMLSSATVVADFLGIYSNVGVLQNLILSATNGPAQQVGSLGTSVLFSQNSTQSVPSTTTVTAAYSDQQYIVIGVEVGNPPLVTPHPSMMFGAQSNNSAKILTPPKPLLVLLSDVGNPSSTYYSPTSNSIGTGMSVNTNYAFEQYVSTEGLLQASASTNGSHYMGKLTYTFSQPVDYPILHVSGLGGFFSTDTVPGGGVATQVFSTDLELTSAGLSLHRLSGTTFTVLDGATIKNVFDYEDYLQGPPVGTGTEGNEAGSGSFMVIGTGITTVTFNVYVNGKMTAGGNPVPSLWSTIAGDPNPKYTGDRFNTTWTLQDFNPTAVTIGDVGLSAAGVPAFLRDVGANDRDAAGLLALLRAWDPMAAAKLQGAGREALLKALRDYLDPDGDGQVVVFRWETLEERGTVGFYAERSQDGVWSRINGEMLPGLIAAPMGAQYWQADPGAQVGDDNQYRLIEVEARGGTNAYGPFDLRTTTP